VLVAPLGQRLEALEHDLVEPYVDLDALRGRLEAPGRQLARQHLVEHDAQREDVGAVVDLARARALLGRHVVRRAEQRVGLRGLRVAGRGDDELREAEVGQLDTALDVHEHVLGLDVAVDDALVVRVLERVADLGHDRQGLARREAALAHQPAQVRALDELHQQEPALARLAEIVDAHDAGMVEPREQACLAQEALGEARVPGRAGREDLERDVAVELPVPRAVDDPHAALADELADLEQRERAGELGRRRCRRARARDGRLGRDLVRGVVRAREPEQAARAARASAGDRRPALRAAS
jgi:hypothetical protein